MKPCLAIIAFLLICFTATAQQYTLSGKITNEQGKPIPFASVYVGYSGSGTSANNEGQYQLQLKPGDYTGSI